MLNLSLAFSPFSILCRQSCVAELLSDEELFFRVVAILPGFKDLDALGTFFAQVPRARTVAVAQAQVSNVLALRNIVRSRADLADALRGTSNALLRTIAFTLAESGGAGGAGGVGGAGNVGGAGGSSAQSNEGFEEGASASQVKQEEDPGLALLSAIDNVLEADASVSRGNVEHMRAQIVYVVKPGASTLLDVARTAYAEVLDGKSQNDCAEHI